MKNIKKNLITLCTLALGLNTLSAMAPENSTTELQYEEVLDRIRRLKVSNPSGRLCRYFFECMNLNPACIVLDDHGGAVTSIAAFPNGDFVTGSCDGTVRFWKHDEEGFHVEQVLDCNDHKSNKEVIVTSVGVLPDGSIVSAWADETPRIWKKVDGKYQLDTMLCNYGYWTHSITVMPDGNILSGLISTTLHEYRIKSGKYLCSKKSNDRLFKVVAFPDGRVISGNGGHSLMIWEKIDDTYQPTEILNDHDGFACTVDVFPDETIVSGAGDATIKIWRRKSTSGRYRAIQTIEDHFSPVVVVAALPSGLIVSGAMNDPKLFVWQTINGSYQCVKLLEGHDCEILCVKDLLDGSIISGSDDETVRVWQLYPVDLSQEQIVLACDLFAAQQAGQAMKLVGDLANIFESLPHYLKQRYKDAVS